MSWQDFYYSDVQTIWMLIAPPAVFWLWLMWRGGDRVSNFVYGFALLFGLLTIVDPLCTGPLSKALGLQGTALGTAIMFFFVLLGDYRVLLLVVQQAEPGRGLRANVLRAAAITLVVPVVTGILYFGVLGWLWPERPGQVMWLIYELSFLALALYGRAIWIRLRARDSYDVERLRQIALYVAAYYALWATADVIILADIDAGWLLRVVPNQLYYSWFIPFAYWRLRG